MSVSSFESVARLSPGEQRRLLENGDGPERLWSAWAIALQLGSDAVPLLAEIERSHVPEGLKRQLLVVLAGLGQRNLLVAIAEADPSPSVRATATALYLRTAASPANFDAVDFAVKQLRAIPPEVRLAVLAEHEAGRAAIPLPEQLALLRDPDPAVRRASLTCLAVNPPSNDGQTIRALIELFTIERDPEPRRQCLALLPRASVRELRRAVAERRPADVGEAVRIAGVQLGPLTWFDVEGLTGTSRLSDLLAIFIAGVRPPPLGGLPWLCRVFRLVKDDDSRLSQDLRWRSLAMIQESLDENTVSLLTAADRTMLFTAFNKAMLDLQTHIDEYGPDSEEGYNDDITRVVQLLSQP
jgi:hypothetical protein